MKIARWIARWFASLFERKPLHPFGNISEIRRIMDSVQKKQEPEKSKEPENNIIKFQKKG